MKDHQIANLIIAAQSVLDMAIEQVAPDDDPTPDEIEIRISQICWLLAMMRYHGPQIDTDADFCEASKATIQEHLLAMRANNL